MTILVSNAPSSNAALKDVLSRAFPLYASKFFGFNDESILIGKSPLIGVQISKRENQITVQGTPPTFLAGILVFVLSLAGFAYYTSEFKKFEKEVASFLYQKFN
jgi:hypothetical protein